MILTTTSIIDGHDVVAYHGIVSAHVVQGANAFKDFAAKMTDIMGGRSGAFERTLQAADSKALKELTSAAEAQGANAIVGIDLDYETIHVAGNMLMVVATGTAVTVRKRVVKQEPSARATHSATGSASDGDRQDSAAASEAAGESHGDAAPSSLGMDFGPGAGFRRG